MKSNGKMNTFIHPETRLIINVPSKKIKYSMDKHHTLEKVQNTYHINID